jgi:hypothetical protein
VIAVFLGITLSRWMRGENECGCFGSLAIPPRTAFFLDLLLVLSLILWRPPNIRPERAWLPYLSLSAGNAIFVLSVLPICDGFAEHLTRQSPLLTKGNAVFVSPAGWVGHPFQLAGLVGAVPDVKEGKWTVIFFRRNCGKCETLLQTCSDYYRGRKILFLEMPPFNGEAPADVGSWKWRRLDERLRWHAQIPIVIDLNEGNVESVANQLPPDANSH